MNVTMQTHTVSVPQYHAHVKTYALLQNTATRPLTPTKKKQNKPKVINCMTKQIFSLNIYIPSRISTSEKLFNAKTIVNH